MIILFFIEIKVGKLVLFLAIYVDDILLTRNDAAAISALKKFLDDQSRLKTWGKFTIF